MGILGSLFGKFSTSSSTSKFYVPTVSVTEQFKGEVLRDESRLSHGLGEQHLYNLKSLEDLYRNFGVLGGIVDKYVDFVVGVGFSVKSDSSEAKEIVEHFMRDVQFDNLLRLWLKEALVKGTGYVEMGDLSSDIYVTMKVLDSKWMFVKRDMFGNIETINQVKLNSRSTKYDSLVLKDFTSFTSEEIAILPINVIGNDVYGSGIIAPAMDIIDKLLGMQSDMNTLLHRKANAPIHAKIGNEQFMPDPGAITDFGQKLETMQAKTEFATDWLVNMKVLDFGEIGEKFELALKHYEDLLFFSVQIPEVIMGRGNIPEGIAKVQMATFERRVKSIQAELEKVIEQTIFRRVLNAKGIKDVHVEFEWGLESATEKNEKITKITNLLNIAWTSPQLRKMLELELATLMGLNEKDLDEEVEPPEHPVVVVPPIKKGDNNEPKQDKGQENEEDEVAFNVIKHDN